MLESTIVSEYYKVPLLYMQVCNQLLWVISNATSCAHLNVQSQLILYIQFRLCKIV